MNRALAATIGRHKRELPPAAALVAVLLAVLVAAPVVLRRVEPARPRAQQRAGAARRGGHDAGDPRRRDRHLGRLAVRRVQRRRRAARKAGDADRARAARRAARRRGDGRGERLPRRHCSGCRRSSSRWRCSWRGATRCAGRRRARGCRTCRPTSSGSALAPAAAQALIVVVAIVVLALCGWALRNLQMGRSLYAVGSDEEAARLAGIEPRRVVFGVFTLMGALVGLAAVLNAVRFNAVPSNAGLGLELRPSPRSSSAAPPSRAAEARCSAR